MMCDLWEIPTFPPDNAGSNDNSLRPVKLSPPTNGAIMRVVEFPPDSERNWAGRKQVFAQYGEEHALSAKEERHPGFHKTPSIDFAVCMQGEIWLLWRKVRRGCCHADVTQTLQLRHLPVSKAFAEFRQSRPPCDLQKVSVRILIVEDEPKTAAYLRKGLSEQGFAVDVASDGLDGLHLATTNPYDLVLLDIMLPGADGWSVLQGLRRRQSTPVLFLSALDAVDDRVKGLQLGADDYLVKPFAFSELLARVHNILRRGAVPREQALRVADLDVDPLRRRVTRAGARIDLTAKEYALLEYFVRHVGAMCSRTLIAESVWDMNFDSDTNVVDVAVRRLRAKIDDPYDVKLIHTVRGVGYVLEARET